MNADPLTPQEAFIVIAYAQAIPEARDALTEALEAAEAQGRLADAFANDCNSLYDGVPEVVSRATAGRTMRDFLPPMKRVRR